MELWQYRQQHAEAVKKVLQETGCLNSKGQIQRWDGPVVCAALEAAGHPYLNFERCGCSKKKER